MTTVIKRGGRKQSFSPGKIKKAVEKAAKEAKVPKAKRDKLVKEVAGAVIALFGKKRSVKAIAIRKAVLSRLERKSKAAAAAWRMGERKKKRKAAKAVKKGAVKKRVKRTKKRVVHHKRKRRR